MKRSIIFLLFVFAVCAFSANMVFAGEPIPGVDVKLGKNPGGGIAFTGKTGKDGKFSVNLKEGNYELALSYDQIKRILSGIDKNYASNPGGYEIDLMLGQTANVKAPAKVIINKETTAISVPIAIHNSRGTLSGTLTYTKVR